MIPDPTLEIIPAESLLSRIREMHEKGFRLVQIGATRLPDQIELTYSFDLDSRLTSLRLHVPAAEPRVPSISSIYGCGVLYENEIHDLFGVRVEGMTVDFQGNFYKTAVKYPFGSPKAPVARAPAPAATPPAAGAARPAAPVPPAK